MANYISNPRLFPIKPAGGVGDNILLTREDIKNLYTIGLPTDIRLFASRADWGSQSSVAPPWNSFRPVKYWADTTMQALWSSLNSLRNIVGPSSTPDLSKMGRWYIFAEPETRYDSKKYAEDRVCSGINWNGAQHVTKWPDRFPGTSESSLARLRLEWIPASEAGTLNIPPVTAPEVSRYDNYPLGYLLLDPVGPIDFIAGDLLLPPNLAPVEDTKKMRATFPDNRFPWVSQGLLYWAERGWVPDAPATPPIGTAPTRPEFLSAPPSTQVATIRSILQAGLPDATTAQALAGLYGWRD